MDILKKVLKVLTILLVIWLGVTVYYISQHSVKGKEAKINETVVFDDVTIELEGLTVYNFKRKPINYDKDEGSKFKYKLLSKLPQSLFTPYFRISFLYSNPYEIDNKYYQTALIGKCLFTKQGIGTTDYHEYFTNHINISILDSVGADYTNDGSMSQYEDDKDQEIDFLKRGREFPIERLQNGVKVIVRHLETGEEREFTVDFEDFVNYKHNDSFGKEFPFKYKIT